MLPLSKHRSVTSDTHRIANLGKSSIATKAGDGFFKHILLTIEEIVDLGVAWPGFVEPVAGLIDHGSVVLGFDPLLHLCPPDCPLRLVSNQGGDLAQWFEKTKVTVTPNSLAIDDR